MNLWLSNILRFLICVLLQVLVVNNLSISGVCTPFVYILFLIALPARTPRWAELLIGLFTGLVIDIFCDSFGVNMAACVLVAYLRPLLIANMVQEKERLTGTINSQELGMNIYLRLIAILIVQNPCNPSPHTARYRNGALPWRGIRPALSARHRHNRPRLVPERFQALRNVP